MAAEALSSSNDRQNNDTLSNVEVVPKAAVLRGLPQEGGLKNTQEMMAGSLLRKRHKSTDDAKAENECTKRKRITVIDRAREWQSDKVQYVFHNFHKGYRTQCSGYVAHAWKVPLQDPSRTPRCYHFERYGLAISIRKDQLQMGDAMVCNSKKYAVMNIKKGQQAGGHCLIFERWTNDSHTAFVGWELCNDAFCSGVTQREIPYPYFYKKNCWEPMRYTNITC